MPNILTDIDYQHILEVIRRTAPADFEEGKALVVLEAKVQQQLSNTIAHKVLANQAARTTPED